MAEITITSANFEKEVLKADCPVVLDFWAPWCGPCRMVAPIVAKIAEKYDGKIKVGKVNVDDEVELATQFRVSAIPMIVRMDKGAMTAQAVGYRPQDALEAELKLDELG